MPLTLPQPVQNDYLGELNLPIESCVPDQFDLLRLASRVSYSWFPDIKNNVVFFDNPENKPRWHSVVSTRSRTEACGAMLVKVGFINTSQAVSGETEAYEAVKEAISEKQKHGRPSRTERVLTAPPTQSVGTIQKREHPLAGDAMENLAYQYEMPGDSTSSESDYDEADDISEASTEPEPPFESAPDTPDGQPSAYFDAHDKLPDLIVSKEGLQDEPQQLPDVSTSTTSPRPDLAASVEVPAADVAAAIPVAAKNRKFGLPLFKRTNSSRTTASDLASLPPSGFASTESIAGTATPDATKKRRFGRNKVRNESSSELDPMTAASSTAAGASTDSGKQKKRKRRPKKSHSYEFGSNDVVGVWFVLLLLLFSSQ